MTGLQRRSLVVIALGLMAPVWVAWLLWFAPLDGLTADRTALAARDFTALWAAGRAAAEQSLTVLSNPAAFTAYLRAMFGSGVPSQIWPYPPLILLLARPMAELSLGAGFVIYTALSIGALWLALSFSGLPARARIAILLSPAVATNALAGQTGALVAALLCGGLLLVDRRPVLSGLLLGIVSFKPQFAVLVPICILASARWRTALSGCASVFTLAFAATYAFGFAPWVDFLSGNQNTVTAYIGAPWQSGSAQLIFSSAFMASRSIGASVGAAYVVQLAVSAGSAYFAWQVWRNPLLDAKRRMAATIPLVLLAAPWVHTYDMPALAVSIVVLLPRAGIFQRVLLALAWLWPGLSPLIPFPPVLAVLSVGSVAWLARSSNRVGGDALQPASG